jgi:hypothetical protein
MAEKKAFDGKLTIDTTLQLIRYNIPVLMLGKSSIGKSYTLIDITKKWNMPHSLLYIGSEKSENIEGVPKLTEREEGREILDYLQPYWFPNAKVITKSVKNGRKLFDKFVKTYWDEGKFDYGYQDLSSLLNALSYLKWTSKDIKGNEGGYEMDATLVDRDWLGGKERTLNDKKPFPLVKKPQQVRKDDGVESELINPDEYKEDDLRDFCLYLTTVLGYGNFWLILDEIDKVEEHDKDKFAPLLHIVRERTLKNFTMIDINNGDGIGIPEKLQGGNNGYKVIIDNVNEQIDIGQSVLDTRVMGIANKTKNIEEALFRRFIQLVAEDILIWRPSEITQSQSKIEGCLVDVKQGMVKNDIQQGELFVPENLIQRIDEINLQWQYNFLPNMLNHTDIQSNLFIANLKHEYAMNEKTGDEYTWAEVKKFTALYKVLEDNFKTFETQDGLFNTAEQLFDCLAAEWLTDTAIGENIRSDEEEAQGIRGEIEQSFETLGDPELASIEISEKLREAYQDVVVAPSTLQTRAQNLHTWTDDVMAYMKQTMYSPNGRLTPLADVYEYLIPALINVFYTEMGKDPLNQSDTVAAVTAKFQAFFSTLSMDMGDVSKLSFDKGAVKSAFYGENPIFGDDDESVKNSAMNGIAKQNTSASLPLFLNIIVDEYKAKKSVKSFARGGEYFGIVSYMKENLRGELEKLNTHYKKELSEGKANDSVLRDAKAKSTLIDNIFLK